jgi:hypothetical protein
LLIIVMVFPGWPPGHLSVFSLARAPKLRLASAPIEVAVGPFSGLSAGGGRVIVSGGTRCVRQVTRISIQTAK